MSFDDIEELVEYQTLMGLVFVFLVSMYAGFNHACAFTIGYYGFLFVIVCITRLVWYYKREV